MTETISIQTERRRPSWFAMTAIFTSAGLLALAGLALYSFGSFGSALDYLRGHRLLLDRPSASFGEVQQGQSSTVVFELTNASDRGITILGTRTLCTCVTAQDVPLSVRPKSRCSFWVSVNSDSRVGWIDEPVYLFTDFPAQPKVELRVVGRVSSSTQTPARSRSK